MSTDRLTLHIDGMTCGACVARVESALHSVPGVTACAVNLTTNLATVSIHSPDTPSTSPANNLNTTLLQAVEKAGYHAQFLQGTAAETLRNVSARGLEHEHAVRRRLVIGILAGLPVLLLDLFHNRLAELASPDRLLYFSLAQLALATVVMLYTGLPFFAGAFRALRHGAANMDVLVALGSGVAYFYSLALLLLAFRPDSHSLHTYHNELHAAVAIVVLVTLGKFLEARAKKRAASAVAGLATQAAATATRILPHGQSETVPAEQIQIGEHIQILAHQTIPLDGLVTQGAGSVDQSLLTGESTPIEIVVPRHAPASQTPVYVVGGSRLLDGHLILQATSTAATSTVARILELVHAAQASKTQIQALADRVAAVFVPIVLLLAALNFAAWAYFSRDLERAMLHTIAVIVIACPCAMGLATPTAVTVAMGRAAKMGILFTKATALETARSIDTVLFDKTGTLTTGQPRVAEILGDPDLLRLAASLEQFSEHPLAKAIVDHARENALPLLEPTRFNSIPGGGIRATFPDGRELAAGSVAFISSLHVPLDQPAIDRLTSAGMTIVALADLRSLRPLGLLGLRDSLRDNAAATIALLRSRNIRVAVVSGDTAAAVRGTLQNITVDSVLSNVQPAAKVQAIHHAKSPADPASRAPISHVAFVGDGINDGPALAAADLGIALASGTQIAQSAGDVILLNNDLAAVPALLELSRRTLRVIKQNLFWAFAYNIAAIPLAMAGLLTPAFAAAAMILSSLTVVTNALRLNYLKTPPPS